MTSEVARLLAVIATARDNLSSLMNAYPDAYPRHAFQGTYELLRDASVGTCADVPTVASADGSLT